MSAEFSMVNASSKQFSQSAVSEELKTFKNNISMFSNSNKLSLFERARQSGYPGLAESKARTCLYSVVGSTKFNNVILLIVIANTLLMILESTKPFAVEYYYYLTALDSVFLGIYLMEMALKIFVFRFYYFKSGWNVFDFCIVNLSLFSTLAPLLASSIVGSSGNLKVLTTFKILKVLKAIRALRVLRTISFLKSLQVVVATLLRSIPALSSIVGLAVLVLVIFAVIARTFYGSVDPNHFGTIGDALFSLFACITLDQWTDLWQNNEKEAPTIGYFLSLFVFIENFVILNVFVAVLVSNLENARKKVKKEFKVAQKIEKESDESVESSSNSSNGSYLKYTTIEEYHPELSLKYKKIMIYQKIYEELSAMDESFYYYDQQNRILNSLMKKE